MSSEAKRGMISVLLCTLNRSEVIASCLDSLIAQTYRNFEIIVVDQSRDDRTENRCREYSDERIRYYRVGFTGLSRARNYGLRFAQGEWICLGDDDAVYDSLFFEKAAEHLRNCGREDKRILCGNLRFLDKRDREVLGYGPYRDGQILNADAMLQIGASATLILPAGLLKEIGGFDTRFGVGARYGSGEESDAVLRMMKLGADACYLPEMKVYHGHSDDDASLDFNKVYKYYIGLGALLKKHLVCGGNAGLFPKFARATAGAWIKWLTGDAKQRKIYRCRIAGFHRGFARYREMPSESRVVRTKRDDTT
ncbi:MAG: glycosyltransferase [Lachnospiraceae bacterium]|nr:glycosyltransferase [Lachnospiraceae bacterium]